MRRRRGEAGFTRVGWDAAWASSANGCRIDPDRTSMYVTSRGITNEVYYTAQKVMRYLGSNNVDNSARLCHSPSTAGSIHDRRGRDNLLLPRLVRQRLIVFFGSNPANNQPVSMKYLLQARKAAHGCSWSTPTASRGWSATGSPPISERVFGTNITDRFVRVGGDLAFLNAVQKVLISEGSRSGVHRRGHHRIRGAGP